MVDEQLHILLIDDNPDDRSLTIRELEREFPLVQVQQITTLRRLNQALEAGGFDLVITDYQLRWSDGLTVLRGVKARYPDLPIVMFTNSGSQEIAVEAMKTGLDDYVIKSPTHFVRLSAAVRSALARVRTERRAARLEEQLQELLNRLNVGVFRAGINGQLIAWNQALPRILGLSSEEATGPLDGREWGLWPAEMSEHLQTLRGRSQPLERELALTGRDGQTRWVFISERLSLAEGQEVIDGLLEDRTAWKQAEREAQAALETREQFLTLAAHELRTPLTTLTGSIQLARRRLDRIRVDEASPGLHETLQPLDELLERAERRTRALHRLVREVLDLAVLERTNQLTPRLEPVDLAALTRTMVQEQRALWPTRSLLIRLPGEAITVLADAAQIGQVVTSYLSNALKFSPSPEPITVMVRAEQDRARVEVRDEGPGLTPDQQARIWERFYRAPGIEHQSGSGVGLGLGLAISKTIIEQHGGQVGVESAPNQGATFWFTLPLASERGE